MKLLVSIRVPAISRSYDVRIPGDMKLSALVPLVAQTVEELSDQTYLASGQEILCRGDLQQVLKKEDTLAGSGVLNGDPLILL